MSGNQQIVTNQVQNPPRAARSKTAEPKPAFVGWSGPCKRWCLVLLLPVALLSGAEGAIYRVSTSGSNNNPGTEAAPWRTIQKAADSMIAGDTVVVEAGNYPELVVSKANGTAKAPIIFQAAWTNAVVSGFSLGHAFQVINGFTINAGGFGAYEAAVTLSSGGHSVSLESNIFNGTPDKVYQINSPISAVFTNLLVSGNQFLNGRFFSMALYGRGHKITANLFSSPNGWDAINLFASDTLIGGNVFTNFSNLVNNPNHPDLIQSFSLRGEVATNNVIDGNLFINCRNTQIGNISNDINPSNPKGRNVSDWTWRNNIWANVDWAMTMWAPDMQFYNNVFYRCGINSSAPIFFRALPSRGAAEGGRVFNNIFAECSLKPFDSRYGWYLVDDVVTRFAADYNLVIGTGAGETKTAFQAAGREVLGINGMDPQFVDAAGLDFRLRATSPGFGAGFDLGALFTRDIGGANRNGGWSIGAYARPGTSPSPPGGLRVANPR